MKTHARAKKVAILFSIGAIVISFILALWLMHLGKPFSEVLLYTIILLTFLLIPIVGAVRKLSRQEPDWNPEVEKTRLSAAVLYVGAPYLVGLLVFILYPHTALATTIGLIILAAAMLFFHWVM
ncbi:MAG: hypothetical protein ACE5JQ_03565 [Candidatus Methylomirabilales bacterium]